MFAPPIRGDLVALPIRIIDCIAARRPAGQLSERPEVDSGELSGNGCDYGKGTKKPLKSPAEPPEKSGVEFERPRPDSNRGIAVLQTAALPLGYEAHSLGFLVFSRLPWNPKFNLYYHFYYR